MAPAVLWCASGDWRSRARASAQLSAWARPARHSPVAGSAAESGHLASQATHPDEPLPGTPLVLRRQGAEVAAWPPPHNPGSRPGRTFGESYGHWQRRKHYGKQAKAEAEGARISIRNIRRDVISDIKELQKAKDISEDEERKAQDDIQKITDRFVAKVEEALLAKEKDLMEI